MNDVTHILNAIEQGDPRTADKLLPIESEEQRRLIIEFGLLHHTRYCFLVSDVKSDILVHSELSENRALGR